MKNFFTNKLLPGCLALAVLFVQPTAARQTLPDLHCPPADTQPVKMLTALPNTSPQQTPPRYRLANGLDVTVYPSEMLAERITLYGGMPVLPLTDGRYFEVITDISDPAIYNKGDGSFHPFDEARVIEILREVSHPNLDMEVVVYLLPYPRRNVLVSSTSGNVVFLSPHVLDIHPLTSAYIVAHEIGHVFHNQYMPDGSGIWSRYRSIRGITDELVFSETASHPYRPKEIFAEDFRVLFGGPDAEFGGRVENSELVSPLDVAGLESFVRAIGGPVVATGPRVKATSYPNPFNPETEIRIQLPDEIVASHGRVTVQIYDVRGALVRELYSDVPTGDNLYVQWDGRDRHGNPVASANYFAKIQAGTALTSLKLVLLK
jgi:hypothetical protein